MDLRGEALLCRGCLGPLDPDAEAGLCGRCWSGLLPLPEGRCSRCALVHDPEAPCRDAVAWEQGDALWDYRGGRPPLGALLVPGIKAGEWGWKGALLRRLGGYRLPDLVDGVDLVTAVPTAAWKRWRRGFDLAEEAGILVASRIGGTFARTLARGLLRPGQTGRPAGERRRLPRRAFALRRRGVDLRGRVVLLVDDVWTTGTSLLRCAERLREGGASEVRVLTLFRAG